jgi:hypothetical protein
MAAEPSDLHRRRRPTDREIRDEIMSDPTARAQAEEVAREVRSGRLRSPGPGVTREDLPDFLRELG